MSKPPNVVFLDFDGVICTHRACAAVGDPGGTLSYLDPIACQLVKRLCTENNARIVISSSWRILYDRLSIEAILNAACAGLGHLMWSDDVFWKTRGWVHSDDDTHTSDRGREIQHWIANNLTNFNHLVILDDMADMRPLQDHLVRCDLYDGIGYKQYVAANQLLRAWP